MTIFEAIREDHQIQRTLVDLLIKTHGDSEGREELYERLEAELKRHEKAEERYFYVPLMKQDLTQEKARHSVAEHHELDELLETLKKTDRSSSGWLATAQKLSERLIHHLDEEEQEVFQLAGKALPQSQLDSLAKQYRAAMDEAGK